MSFRFVRLAIAVLLGVAGVVVALRGWPAAGAAGVLRILEGVALVAGAGLTLRAGRPFAVFRWLALGVLGAVTISLVGGGLAGALAAAAAGRSAASYVSPALQVLGGLLVIGVYYYALWAASRIHRILENIFAIPELLGKIAFTLALLCIYRIGFYVPLPGLDSDKVAQMLGKAGGAWGEALQYITMFTGGNLRQSTLFGLGIMPYISASIIFQLLITVVPALERLQKEGPVGQRKIREYTRYATVLLCVIQAVFWMNFMRSRGLLYAEYQSSILVYLIGVLGLTGGTVFLMWLGEQIDEYGIGNGISLLIMAGIVARLPGAINQLRGMVNLRFGDPGGAESIWWPGPS